MNQMTSDNLRSAFGGESQARTRYNIWGNVAEKDGFKNVKRLLMQLLMQKKFTQHFTSKL